MRHSQFFTSSFFMHNNDPALTSLTVGIDLHMHDMSRTDGFFPHENDWGKLGRFIGRNTHITEVSAKISDVPPLTVYSSNFLLFVIPIAKIW